MTSAPTFRPAATNDSHVWTTQGDQDLACFLEEAHVKWMYGQLIPAHEADMRAVNNLSPYRPMAPYPYTFVRSADVLEHQVPVVMQETKRWLQEMTKAANDQLCNEWQEDHVRYIYDGFMSCVRFTDSDADGIVTPDAKQEEDEYPNNDAYLEEQDKAYEEWAEADEERAIRESEGAYERYTQEEELNRDVYISAIRDSGNYDEEEHGSLDDLNNQELGKLIEYLSAE